MIALNQLLYQRIVASDRLICDDCVAGPLFHFVSSAAFYSSKAIPQMFLLRAVEAMRGPIIVFPVRFKHRPYV